MTTSNDSSKKGGIATGTLLAGAVSLLALPSAVLAFTADFTAIASASPSDKAVETIDSETAAGNLARPFQVRSLAKGQLYPFTPAGSPNRPDRSVTVAVRVDAQAAQAISVIRSKVATGPEPESSELRISPTAFNLGVSRGYKNFSQNMVPPAKKSITGIPDLGQYSIAPGKGAAESRFSPRIVMDETQTGGRSPRTYAGAGDDRVDVGGAYRVAKNLDVTAGVRYSQERERLLPPLTDGQQDNQAVYVGTQFRF